MPHLATSEREGPTETELALMHLLVQGCTDADVRSKLGWGERRFRRHLRSVQDKLGATSRIQTGYLVALAGWLAVPGRDSGPEKEAPNSGHRPPAGKHEPGTNQTA